MTNLLYYVLILQVSKQVTELDQTRARLRNLEQSIDPKKVDSSQAIESSHSNSKSENRVHFDLNISSAPNEVRKPARSARPNSSGSSSHARTNNTHLPSDARQRLEQLVKKKISQIMNL